MSNGIGTREMCVVGEWRGEDIAVLWSEIARIRNDDFRAANASERLLAKGMPRREQLPEGLHGEKARQCGICNRDENGLSNTPANGIDPLEHVRSFSAIDDG